MTTKTVDFETQTFTYASIAEMMAHIGTMGAGGWELVYASNIALSATYKKDLPL